MDIYNKNMKGKLCLISGANSGIGLEAAVMLAQKGAHIIMACRSLDKANAAKEIIEQRSGSNKVDILLVDFASQESIRKMAKQFYERYDHLDVLLNNAGLIATDRHETSDGYEYTFAVNHLGYFMITCLLIDALRAAPKARIVNVASEAHRVGSMNFDDIHLRKGYSNIKAYAQSKLANILFTKELAERLKGTNITANSLHPGVVDTNFAGNSNILMRGLMLVAKPFMVSPKQGASTSVYLASDESVEGVTGKYFAKMKPKTPSSEAQDAGVAKHLWGLSEALTGVTLGV